MIGTVKACLLVSLQWVSNGLGGTMSFIIIITVSRTSKTYIHVKETIGNIHRA